MTRGWFEQLGESSFEEEEGGFDSPAALEFIALNVDLTEAFVNLLQGEVAGFDFRSGVGQLDGEEVISKKRAHAIA